MIVKFKMFETDNKFSFQISFHYGHNIIQLLKIIDLESIVSSRLVCTMLIGHILTSIVLELKVFLVFLNTTVRLWLVYIFFFRNLLHVSFLELHN